MANENELWIYLDDFGSGIDQIDDLGTRQLSEEESSSDSDYAVDNFSFGPFDVHEDPHWTVK